MEKVTKKGMFAIIKEVCKDYPEIIDFCNHEIELLNKKSSKSGTTKNQAENLIIMDTMCDLLSTLDEAVTITDFQSRFPEMAKYSNQKLSALFRILCENKRVCKKTDKKKSFFFIEK